MNIMDKASLVKHLINWRLTWAKRNTHYTFTVPGNPKFMGPRDAVKLINDGSVVATSGLGGNQRASIMYWAVQEMYKETGKPRDLTFCSIGGHGGRGIAPGTVEEMGLPGLCTRFFAGHLETFKAQLKLGDEGKCEIQVIPQGTEARLFASQARGEDSLLTPTGVGTFIDPRVGRGTPLNDPNGKQYVVPEGDQLRFSIPKINVALFNAPAADRKGNIYVKNASMIGESYEAAMAAKRNGGIVIVNVGLIVDEGYDDIFLAADKVDAIVYYPRTEQTGSIYHDNPLDFFTTNSSTPIEEGVARTKFINQILGITPRRNEVDNALARLAASTFAENARKGMNVNVGVGLPEEVCRLLFEGGLLNDVKLLVESGVIGGVPAPGVFFGASICPERMISSPCIFDMFFEKLDVTTLGFLQVDSEGNVNVSKRGEGAINYVGPGGFMELTTAAKMVNFVGTFMAHSKMSISPSGLKIVKRGKPKFVDKVDEITFSGREALKRGMKIFYNTNVGVFRLTERGVELCSVMPGVDIKRDILDFCPMKIVLPENGNIPVVGKEIVTGEGFKLSLKS